MCYRPPNAGSEFLQEFTRFLKCAKDSRHKDIIILGDFNFPSIHWLNGSVFSDTSTDSGFSDVLQEAGLLQLVNSATHGQNLLHLLPTMNEYLIDNISVTDDDSVCLKSDHKAITSDINLIRKLSKPVKRMVYNYKNGDFDSLRATLRCLPLLDLVDSESDIDSAWSKWKHLFLAGVDSHIPKTNVKSSYKPPYITQEVIHMLTRSRLACRISTINGRCSLFCNNSGLCDSRKKQKYHHSIQNFDLSYVTKFRLHTMKSALVIPE